MLYTGTHSGIVPTAFSEGLAFALAELVAGNTQAGLQAVGPILKGVVELARSPGGQATAPPAPAAAGTAAPAPASLAGLRGEQ